VRNGSAAFESLSAIVDRAIGRIGGPDSDGARKILLRHERVIRNLVANGTTGTLGKLWKLATPAEDAAAVEVLEKARKTLDVDGELLDCDATMPARLFMHAWRFAQDRKLAKIRSELDRLILRLRNILRADVAASAASRTPEQLKASIGTAFQDAFDFESLSVLLTAALPEAGMTAARRARIRGVLEQLESQRFVRAPDDAHAHDAHRFVYTSCHDLQEAYCERLPELTALAKALALGALEAKGEYNEAQHDALFEGFGANGLTKDELAQFPDYLLWVHAPLAEEYGELMGMLAGNVPVKVMVQFDDLLEPSLAGDGQLTLSLRSKQLADLAIGLNDVYVLLAAAASLVKMREPVLKGLTQPGPALFSVYSGAHEETRLPADLVSAAALESRAFPTFSYDPSAGGDWAARFSLEGNPQPERDWPVQSFTYEDGRHERVALEVEFTLTDVMACDARYARHFARVPAAKCNGDMLTVREWLAHGNAAGDRVPALLMVDRDNVIQRVIVDSRAIEETKRLQAIWRGLQELGGIHNSHAERLLAREKRAWEDEKRREIEALGTGAGPADARADRGQPGALREQREPVPVSSERAAERAPVEEARSTDEAYIETPRCTTCEECVHINNRMFVYDANKQAYIADLAAGSYRELVEAAEVCQVSIIHPGKPRDPSEPGIEELLERARVFD
jgi:hypothetical protein